MEKGGQAKELAAQGGGTGAIPGAIFKDMWWTCQCQVDGWTR